MTSSMISNVFKILSMLVLALILYSLMLGNTTRVFVSNELDNLFEGRVRVVSGNYGKDMSELENDLFNQAISADYF